MVAEGVRETRKLALLLYGFYLKLLSWLPHSWIITCKMNWTLSLKLISYSALSQQQKANWDTLLQNKSFQNTRRIELLSWHLVWGWKAKHFLLHHPKHKDRELASQLVTKFSVSLLSTGWLRNKSVKQGISGSSLATAEAQSEDMFLLEHSGPELQWC